jgi:hypothetical protein
MEVLFPYGPKKSGVGSVTGEVNVVFTCQNAETVWGQNVYVVGSNTELGDWDTDKARILNSKNYPDWENTISDLPADTHIEWKCLKKDGAGNVQWQSGENNRFTTPRSGTGNTSGSFSTLPDPAAAGRAP